jgi:hypothetical protein
MEPEHSQISPFLSAGLFFLVHAALLAFCGWIKSWWNEPLGIDGFRPIRCAVLHHPTVFPAYES